MGISSLAERIGMFLAATAVIATTSSCSTAGQTLDNKTAASTQTITITLPTAQQLPDNQAKAELEVLGFTNPRHNPDSTMVTDYPWVAEAGHCTLQFVKLNRWSAFYAFDSSYKNVAVITDVSASKLLNTEIFAVCFGKDDALPSPPATTAQPMPSTRPA